MLAGFGRYMTYSDDYNFKKPYVNKEWRLWEQFLVNTYTGRVKIENRFRIEQRWTSSLGYRNRFKYRLNMVLPVTNKKILPGTFYLSGWDEISLTDRNPNFEQNRIYAGAGYQLFKHLAIQSGYIYQANYKRSHTHSDKNYLQLAFLVEANAHKERHEKNLSGLD